MTVTHAEDRPRAEPVPHQTPHYDLEQVTRAERKVLSQITSWFHAANSLDELLTIVRTCLQALLPEAAGQLYIYSDDREGLNLACHWGGLFIDEQIEAEDCWCLRRGRAFSFGTNEIDFPCAHLDSDVHPAFCLPVIAHGNTIGFLHLVFQDVKISHSTPSALKAQLESRWDFALICAEQISLAVANVQLRQALHRQSVRDQLTGLWNRRWFVETATRELNRALARHDSLSLISFDIDHFKSVNDTFGHDAGDTVLSEVAVQIDAQAHDGRAACRVGGEEFIMILPNTSAKDAALVAERICTAVAQMPIHARRVSLPTVTLSAGVAAVPDCGDDLESLIAAADEALYASKKDGRNRVTIFAPRCKAKRKPGPKKR